MSFDWSGYVRARQRRWRQHGCCVACGRPAETNPRTGRPFARCRPHRLKALRSSQRYHDRHGRPARKPRLLDIHLARVRALMADGQPRCQTDIVVRVTGAPQPVIAAARALVARGELAVELIARPRRMRMYRRV